MKKKKLTLTIVIILIIVAATALYLNRAYARIYSRFGLLKQPEVINMTVEKKDKNIKYAALGDSLTFGSGTENTTQSWPAILAGQMTDNQTSVELVNLAVPGALSSDVINHQLPEAIKINPDLVTLLVGVNDLHNFVSLDAYRNNLKQILSELKSRTKARIIIINLPDLGTANLILPPYGYYFSRQTDNYNAVLTETSASFGLQPIDINSTKNIFSADSAYYSIDEFHPSAKGYAVWANLIYDSIN